MKRILYSLFICFVSSISLVAQQKLQPKIVSDTLTYDFGTIAEESVAATHAFNIKNSGDAPLHITRVTTSCGCTQPEWTGSPILPQQKGFVKITYDPNGRPGPFIKTIAIHSNAQDKPYMLAIKGVVTPRQPKPIYNYPYALGLLKSHAKRVLFESIHHNEVLTEQVMLKNETKHPITIDLGKYPTHLTVSVHPQTLEPGAMGELSVLLDGAAFKKRGQHVAEIPLILSSSTNDKQQISLKATANVIDDFTEWSKEALQLAPRAQLSSELLDFGTVTKRKKITKTIQIFNDGESPLSIYSLTANTPFITIKKGKKEIKPGRKATYKITVNAKELDKSLETVITVISNDPEAPIQYIKATIVV